MTYIIFILWDDDCTLCIDRLAFEGENVVLSFPE